MSLGPLDALASAGGLTAAAAARTSQTKAANNSDGAVDDAFQKIMFQQLASQMAPAFGDSDGESNPYQSLFTNVIADALSGDSTS